MPTPNYMGLIEAIRRNRLVVIVDLPLTTTRANELSKKSLIIELKKKLSVEGEYTLEQIVDFGIRRKGKENFIPLLSRIINQNGNVPQSYYALFDKLGIKYIVDTHYSPLFRSAVTDGAVSGIYSFYSRDDDVLFNDDGQIIVSLFGDPDYNKDKLITSDNEFNAFFANMNSISAWLQSIFRSTILFVDFDSNTDRFKRIYDFICQRSGKYPSEAFLVSSTKAEQLSYGTQENLVIIESDACAFLENLINQVKVSASVADDDGGDIEKFPQVPYKYLLSFEQNEHCIFFGREKEISELSLRVRGATQISMLTSLSGYGKTSMINAGLIPKLLATHDYDVYYIRAGSNPWENVVSGVFQKTPDTFDLAETTIESLSKKQYQLIIIDQFEECFVKNTEDDLVEIDKKMKQLFDRFPTISVLISIRQDFYTYLTKFKFLNNPPMSSTYILEPLSASNATEAIKKPAEFELYDFSYEDGMVEQIVKDLSTNEDNHNAYIDPSQLQIVCYFLYQELKSRQERTISAEIYNELGRANGILENYIDESLKINDEKRQRLGKEILKCLVSSKGTRISKTSQEIISELSASDIINEHYPENEIKFMIERLVTARLLRIRNQSENKQVYELTHEYIIRKITEWMGAETLKIKEVAELLRVEYTKWSLYKTIMPKILYDEIWKYRAKINFTPQEKSYILLCLISYSDYCKEEMQYWISQNKCNISCDADLTFAVDAFTGKKRIFAGILLHTLYPEVSVAEKICMAFSSNINPHLTTVESEIRELGISVDERLLRKLHDSLNRARRADMCTVLSNTEVHLGLPPKTRYEIIKKHDFGKSFKQFFPDKERVVKFSLYQIDKYTVTNRMYAEYDESHRYKEDQADHPVVGISAEQALAYAHWWGKDLPTEDEWEYAARGADFRSFPWGNDWDYETEKRKAESDKLCNTSLTGTDGPRSSKEYSKGKSPFGCYNMAGNVWEWTKTPVANDEARLYVKGGSWSMFEIMPWTWYRYISSRESGQQNIGFRCVLRSEV